MDGLYKLLFYVIVGIVWILSNTKKQALWKEDDLKSPPARPKGYALPKPKIDQFSQESIFSEYTQPAREGVSLEPEQPAAFDIKKQPVLQTDFNFDDYLEEETKPSNPAIVCNRRQKQSYHLKSSLKEGIIWSIVLGAPRSKQAFNRHNSMLTR